MLFRVSYLLLALVMLGVSLLPKDVKAQGGDGHLLAMPQVSYSGVFDPSLADTPPGQRAWMSYSAVDPSPRWPQTDTRTMTTRLAYSDDGGSSWRDLGTRVNRLSELQLSSGKGGTWNSEVSSLVFDPSAPPRERWKLFWHHYLAIGNNGQFQNGWIAYKHAGTADGLISAPEIKLFGAFAYNHDNDSPGSANGSPVAGAPLVETKNIDRLGMCVALSEPGAMVTPSGLYMSLDCFMPKVANPIGLLGMGVFGAKDDIVLLKCDAPCHPEHQDSWRYISTLLTPDDANAFGFNSFSGTDLFLANGHAYLIASPVSNKPVNNAYNGCFVFRFADLESGMLERPGGRLSAVMTIQGSPNTFNGACTYQASVPNAGFLYGQITFADRPVFHIYATGPGRRLD